MKSNLSHILSFLLLCPLFAGCNDNGQPAAPPGFWKLYEGTVSEAKVALEKGKPAEAEARLLALHQSSSKYLPPNKMEELERLLDECSQISSSEKGGVTTAEATNAPRGALYLTKRAKALCEKAALLESQGAKESKLSPIYDQVLETLRRARREGERDDSHATLYGLAYLGLGHSEKALPHFLEAAKLAPGKPEPLMLQAACHQTSGRLDEEIAALRGCVLLDDNQLDAHYQLVLALMKKGKKDEAIKHGEKAIGLNPRRAVEFARLVGDEKLTTHFEKVAKANIIRAQQQRSYETDGNLAHGTTAAPSVIAAGAMRRQRKKRSR